jgi:hypothetical protein
MATKKRWMHVPPKPAKPKVPEYVKTAVDISPCSICTGPVSTQEGLTFDR